MPLRSTKRLKVVGLNKRRVFKSFSFSGGRGRGKGKGKGGFLVSGSGHYRFSSKSGGYRYPASFSNSRSSSNAK